MSPTNPDRELEVSIEYTRALMAYLIDETYDYEDNPFP